MIILILINNMKINTFIFSLKIKINSKRFYFNHIFNSNNNNDKFHNSK